MTDLKDEVIKEFVSNIEGIASDLIDCFGLKHKKEIPNLSDCLFRWMDFRLRYIDPKARTVFISKKLNRPLPTTIDRPLRYLFNMFQRGDDVNSYQGKGLILHHDTSGKTRYNRTDLLWADWGIYHFHLTTKPIPKGKFFSDPSDWLLFALVGDDFAACIDVRSHKEKNLFSNPDLFRIAIDSWPDMMNKFKMRSISAPETILTAEEYGKLRKGGVMAPVCIGEDVYMGPGMGLSSASTSSKVTLFMDNILESARALADLVCEPGGQFLRDARELGCNAPQFRLCITPQGLSVYESTLDKAWVLPRRKELAESNYLADLHDMLAPEWAVNQLSVDFESKRKQKEQK
jgi:hypothetical protein